MSEQRKKVWIDRFQTILMLRIAAYFFFYQIGVWALVVIEWNTFHTLQRVFGDVFAMGVMIFFAAIVIGVGVLFTYDAVLFAHKIVGPIVRFRRACQAVRDGDLVEPLTLRKDDYLLELRDEFNEMLKALEARGAIAMKTPEDKNAEAQPSEAAA